MGEPAVDVAVIGGGLMGWSTAYRLVRSGLSVTVIDRGDPGYATAAGAGIIAPGTSFRALPAFYPFASAAVAFYPVILSELAEDGEIDTGYEQVGALMIAKDAGEIDWLKETLRVLTERRADGMGYLGEISWIDGKAAKELFPALADIPAAIHLTEPARVNGRLLRDSLRRAAEKRGAKNVTGTATPLVESDHVVGVQIDGAFLPAGAIVVAGGAWSGQIGRALGITIPTEPQRGQIIHLDMPGTETGTWPIILGHFEHYILTFRPNRVVIGATRETGSGFDIRMTAGGVRQVLNEGLGIAPGLADATIAEIRIGMRPASPDGLPIIGRAPGLSNAYVCTGHGPSGLQLGPISGAAVAAMVQGAAPEIDLTPFTVERFQS